MDPNPAAVSDDSIPGSPPIVDMSTWNEASAALLAREKALTRESDALAAERRRLPMVEVDGGVDVVGPDGAVPFTTLFGDNDELIVYQHMWYDGAPHQGQCEGCTTAAWQLDDSVYLAARGVSFAIVTAGEWSEVERFVDFMGYRAPWYSVRGLDAPIGGAMGNLQCYLRRGDRVFLTYSTTGRGIERVSPFLGLLDITPYGRREGWEEVPEGWPDPIDAGAPVGGHGAPVSSCWRTTVDGVPDWGPTSRPVPQWTREGATAATTLGREGPCH